jgi:hypothetical protein
VIAALLSAVVPGVPAELAGADASVPDSSSLREMRADLSRAMAVRVTGPSGKLMLRDVHLDANGVTSARWGPGAAERPAVITTAGAMPPPTPPPIGWSDISRIETGRTNVARDALLGMAIGAAVGAVVWETVPLGYDGGQGNPAVVIGVPALAGFGLGLLLGPGHYRWTTVYRR